MSPLLLPLLEKVVSTVGNFLDPTKKAEAELAILKLQQDAAFKDIDTALEQVRLASANITTEGASQDKWTSRARPSFMYVIYILILSSLPMAALHAFNPEVARGITEGFQMWLAALPEGLLALFGVGYVGYVGGRSLEKIKGVK